MKYIKEITEAMIGWAVKVDKVLVLSSPIKIDDYFIVAVAGSELGERVEGKLAIPVNKYILKLEKNDLLEISGSVLAFQSFNTSKTWIPFQKELERTTSIGPTIEVSKYKKTNYSIL